MLCIFCVLCYVFDFLFCLQFYLLKFTFGILSYLAFVFQSLPTLLPIHINECFFFIVVFYILLCKYKMDTGGQIPFSRNAVQHVTTGYRERID